MNLSRFTRKIKINIFFLCCFIFIYYTYFFFFYRILKLYQEAVTIALENKNITSA